MTDWPLIAVRFAVYLALAALFGLAAFSLYGLRASERNNALPLRAWLVGSAMLALLLSGGWLWLVASAMAGTALWPIDQDAIGAVLATDSIGPAFKLRMIALAIAAPAALFAAGRTIWLGVVALCGGIALGTLAWTGHGSMAGAGVGRFHPAADIAHLLASGVWVGALLGLVLLASRPAARTNATHMILTHRALHDFGKIGTAVVATLVFTGLVNAWMLVGPGNILSLTSTLYGQLLLAKLALFVAMLGLAGINRFRLVPAFAQSIEGSDQRIAIAALRSSLAVETACIVAVVALVALLGTLAPPATAM